MALVSHISCLGKPLIAYNVHLESRGGDDLRCSQLAEIIADAQQYTCDVPIVIAGDFNCDLSKQSTASVLSQTRLYNPFNGTPVPGATTNRSRPGRPRAIDWILVRGRSNCMEPVLHDSVPGSDHYPLSLTLLNN